MRNSLGGRCPIRSSPAKGVNVPVDVKPWVVANVSAVLSSHNPLFRPILGRILFDLHNHLPRNLALYQPNRVPGSPRCFWYARTHVVNNSSPSALRFRGAGCGPRDSSRDLGQHPAVTRPLSRHRALRAPDARALKRFVKENRAGELIDLSLDQAGSQGPQWIVKRLWRASHPPGSDQVIG